jgi:hypothetical protein
VTLKIPKHGGPDGQGLGEESFNRLLEIVKDAGLTDADKKWSIELCFSASTQDQWNNNYRPRLIETLKHDN